MKNVLFIALVPLFFTFNSCTCSSGCTSIAPVSLSFEGYTLAELDSIKLERFDSGTLFRDKADERFLLIDASTDSNNRTLSFGLRDEYDYRITVLSDNNQFDITEVEDTDGSTKGRGLCLRYTKEALECPLESLQLNGANVSTTNNTSIVLTK